MSSVAFADIVHQTIYFNRGVPSQAIVLKLVDTPWVQRLRHVAQTGNTSLVYMFSEHSRFGHSLGVAYLANHLMDRLSDRHREEVETYRTAVSAAALLHDIGHFAPGSHTAYKIWYPGGKDCHEQISLKIIREDNGISSILERVDPKLPELVTQILSEDDSLPPWTWEIISGSGWNVDRGNWCIVDSVMAGVNYGRYNIPALLESMVITKEGHLAVRENRLDALMHFAIARHSMYRQVYHHRVLLAADTIGTALVKRLRDTKGDLKFRDTFASEALDSDSALDLSLNTIFAMRESWWDYHLFQWCSEHDSIVKDLSERLINRKLLKTVRIRPEDNLDELRREANIACEQSGFDPQYYLHYVTATDMQESDHRQSMRVLMDDGSVRFLGESEPLWNALANEGKTSGRAWLVIPDEAKQILGRDR